MLNVVSWRRELNILTAESPPYGEFYWASASALYLQGAIEDQAD